MVTQFYPPIVGGQEQVVRNLSNALVRRGHDVAIATLRIEGPAYEVQAGVRIHRIGGTFQRLDRLFSDPSRRHVPPIPDPEAVVALGRLLDEVQPDIIHAHDWLVHSLLGLRRRKRFPLILSLHDYGLVCSNKRLIRFGALCDGPSFGKCLRCSADTYGPKGVPIAIALAASQPRTRSRVDRFLPISDAVATLTGVRAQGLPYTVVPNFMSEDSMSSQEDEPADQLLPANFACFVGDVTHDKGIDVLLEAHRRLQHRIPLVLIGRPLAPSVQDAIPNVFVLGTRSHSFVLEALRRCAVAVVPSVCPEAFSLAALEAMSVGRPVAASRIGGLADVVDEGRTGILTTPGDAETLAAAMARLFDDAELQNQMGEFGRRRAEELFSESVVVPLVERIYGEVVDQVNVESARDR